MVFLRIIKYLKYTLLSKNKRGHGIHSPFVFDLVTRVFRNKIDPGIVNSIELIRKKLISDHRLINVKDLGTGSDKRKTKLRRVSVIARYSPVKRKYGAMLSNMSSEFGDRLIVEFGTSFGISTMYLAKPSKDTLIYTMEGCPETAKIAEMNFKVAKLDNIRVFTGDFDESLSEIIKEGVKPGLVFIDGNHRKQAVLRYFRRISDISDSKTVIIIDDIYYSREMEEAWKEIKKFNRVSVSIDIFRMGIVFFKEMINRNDYIIRY